MAVRIDIWTVSPLIALALGALVLVEWRRGRSAGYLACLALFGIYLATVAQWTIFPIEVGIDASTILAMADGRTLADAMQLIPFHDGALAPTRFELVGNILLGVPFGFGLPFISDRRGWGVLVDGLIFAGAIELIQLFINVAYGIGFRVVDVNDVILVWVGALVGYAAFWLVASIYRTMTERSSETLAQGYLHDVLTR